MEDKNDNPVQAVNNIRLHIAVLPQLGGFLNERTLYLACMILKKTSMEKFVNSKENEKELPSELHNLIKKYKMHYQS